MDNRPHWQWKLCLVAVVVGCGADSGSKCADSKEPVSRFRERVNSLPTVHRDAVSVEVFRFPKKSHDASVGLSPNGLSLGVAYEPNGSFADREVAIIDIRSKQEIVRFVPIRGQEATLIPFSWEWSPDSSELHVSFRFADLSVGDFWFRWNLQEKRFTDAAQAEIDRLCTLPRSKRPDTMAHPKGYDFGPIWMIDGRKFESVGRGQYARMMDSAAERALMWTPPSFLGCDRLQVHLKEFQEGDDGDLHEILCESRSHRLDDDRHYVRAHVFRDGRLTETFQTPCRFVDGGLLFEYRDGNVWAYADSVQKRSNNKHWQTNLGPVNVMRMFDLTRQPADVLGDAVVVLKEDNRTSVRLIQNSIPRQ